MNTKSKNRKITVLLEEEEFQRFDEYCSSKGHKKSTLISILISDYLNQNNDKNKLKTNDS